jgi:serine/threonine protein kinase
MQRIGRYELTGELGRGAMGIVYRAQDPAIGRTVAIKTIRLSDISTPDEMERLRERLMREARSAGILSNPHIVTIYDIGQEGEIAFIAMEFVSGPTLESLMKRPEPPDRKLVLTVLRDTAVALDYAHTKGIIHRDIKPANIMVRDDGVVKITDFGVAKIVSQQITQADIVLGTPSYMSPEQIESRELDGRSDQWALAVMAYELLTGEKPFHADSLPALLFRIVKENPPPPQNINPALRPEIERIINKGLAKAPGERYPTCLAFASALAAALQDCRDWKPMARGALSGLETVVTPAVDSGPEPARPLPGDSNATQRTASVETVAQQESAPPPPPPPAPVQAPVALPPSRRRIEIDAQKGTPIVPPPPSRSSGLSAGWMAAVGLVLLGGASYFALPYLLSTATVAPEPEPAPVEEPKPEPPPVVQQPKPEPPPVEEIKPPPVPVEEVKVEPKPPPTPAPKPQQPKPAQTVQTAQTVDIGSSPAGAGVYIDNLRMCSTPCPLDLTPGRYVMRFSLDGHRETTRIVNVPQDTTVSVNLERVGGTLMVKSTPSDANIFIDGKPQPQRTPAVLSLAPGRYKLTLRKQGLADYEEEIQIRDRVISNIEVNWQP